MKEKVETEVEKKNWKLKNENFENKYIKRIWKVKIWKIRKHLESFKKVEQPEDLVKWLG